MAFLKNVPPSYPIFQKRRRIGRTVCIHLQIYEMILFASFCVFLLEHFDVFWMILLFSFFDMVFCKDFVPFFNQIERKTGNRFYPPNKNNKPMETLQTKHI